MPLQELHAGKTGSINTLLEVVNFVNHNISA